MTGYFDEYQASCEIYNAWPFGNKLIASRRDLPVQTSFSELRDLWIEIPLPPASKRNWVALREELILPNDYTQDEEFYSVAVKDFVKERSFEVTALDIDISDARVEISYGTSGAARINHLEIKRSGRSTAFRTDLRRLKPGAKIELRWHWNLKD